MQFSSSLLENAVNEFAKLPGIGKKTALRMVLHLLKQDEAATENFSETIARMRRDIKFCQRCHNVSDADICSICANSLRNQRVICVVETIRDVIAIENTQQFSGTYHILGGVISPLDGIGPDQLQIESLVQRIQKGTNRRIDLCAQSEHTRRHHYLLHPEKDQKLKLHYYHHCPRNCLRR
jgi:recombination protein RecR